MRIAVVAPVYLTNEEHIKYLDLTTGSLFSADHDIVFIPVENYIDPSLLPVSYGFISQPESIHIVKPDGQQSVSKAWNWGVDKAKELKCDYVLIVNTDIVVKSNAIDRLVSFAESHPEAVIWTMAEWAEISSIEEAPEDENFSEHPHFSCFMVKTDFFDNVGRFDENFVPAYLEDGDMHARLALANKKAYIYGGARFFHFGSRTIKSDQNEWEKNTHSFPKNQQYFISKWGCPPVNEVDRMREVYFKHPYNEEDKDLAYWKKNE